MPKPNNKQNTSIAETRDLRTPPIYIARALHYSYEPLTVIETPLQDQSYPSNLNHKPPQKAKITHSLEKGDQAKIISAASRAYQNGTPLNLLVTVRWSTLPNNSGGTLMKLPTFERVKIAVERIRKWLTRPNRRLPVAYVWSREISEKEGEHWHVAIHLPRKYQASFLDFLQRLLGEEIEESRRPAHKRTKGEIACSKFGSWHVATEASCNAPEFSGYWIGAYLGKGEPSQVLFRGKCVNNKRKLERGRLFGGRLKDGKYDDHQGAIEGNHARKGRFGISRNLCS